MEYDIIRIENLDNMHNREEKTWSIRNVVLPKNIRDLSWWDRATNKNVLRIKEKNRYWQILKVRKDNLISQIIRLDSLLKVVYGWLNWKRRSKDGIHFLKILKNMAMKSFLYAEGN